MPTIISLPKVSIDEPGMSLEMAMEQRRSVRKFRPDPINMGQLSQLLWAAQGKVTHGRSRTAPSAGAIYPLSIYVIVNSVEDLPHDVYMYYTIDHVLMRSGQNYFISDAALGQVWIDKAPVIFVITAEFERMVAKYGHGIGERFAYIEAGHVGQNVCLQAVKMGLGTCIVGAFNQIKLIQAVGIYDGYHPISVIPIGHAA